MSSSSPGSPVAVGEAGVPREPAYPRPVAWMWWPAYWATQIALHARFRPRLRGRSELLEGPLVVCAKHCHYWDVPGLGKAVVNRVRERPSFEMARFDGYFLLGWLQHLFDPLGGFSVMRPKDALRLKKREGLSSEEMREAMRAINARAQRRRATIVRGGGVYCFFPEGTRDPRRLREMRSENEVEEAIALADAGSPVRLLPISLCYGPSRGRFRRRDLEIWVGEPVELRGTTASEALARAHDWFAATWRPAGDRAGAEARDA